MVFCVRDFQDNLRSCTDSSDLDWRESGSRIVKMAVPCHANQVRRVARQNLNSSCGTPTLEGRLWAIYGFVCQECQRQLMRQHVHVLSDQFIGLNSEDSWHELWWAGAAKNLAVASHGRSCPVGRSAPPSPCGRLPSPILLSVSRPLTAHLAVASQRRPCPV